MATVKRFEDLLVWQKAMELRKGVRFLTRKPPFKKDPILVRQIERASSSISENIAEGYGRGGTGEFRQFLSQAKGSCTEVKSQLHQALDDGFLTAEQHSSLYDLADHVERMLVKFIRYLTDCEHKGWKYKREAKET